jgi:hypothetical protein
VPPKGDEPVALQWRSAGAGKLKLELRTIHSRHGVSTVSDITFGKWSISLVAGELNHGITACNKWLEKWIRGWISSRFPCRSKSRPVGSESPPTGFA